MTETAEHKALEALRELFADYQEWVDRRGPFDAPLLWAEHAAIPALEALIAERDEYKKRADRMASFIPDLTAQNAELLAALRAFDDKMTEVAAWREKNGYGSIFDGALDGAHDSARAAIAKAKG